MAPRDRHALALVRIAALFHDLGKATELFQAKLATALAGGRPEADAVRHELFSTVVWDLLFGSLHDRILIEALGLLTPETVDAACHKAIDLLLELQSDPEGPLRLSFLERPDSIAFAIGMLVLTHHRLPDGSSNHRRCLAGRHVRPDAAISRTSLMIAEGEPYWHEPWWVDHLRRDAANLSAEFGAPGLDIVLRATLMFADHVGSARKQASGNASGHLANTLDGVPADSLSTHVRKVYVNCRPAYSMLRLQRDRFPALEEGALPFDIHHPKTSLPRFAWQGEAAAAAQVLCSDQEGGFFACILAGTGSGKTRGAPTIMAAAAFADARPERRYLRMTLALGLRVLATQSAREYIDQLGFQDQDIAVLVGSPPIEFARNDDPQTAAEGSESLEALPEWLRVEWLQGAVPEPGMETEDEWLRGLSLDLDRGLPAFCDMVVEASRDEGRAFRNLVSSPLLVATVDHLMAVASPVNSRFLAQIVRVGTADLILDEIDQYDPEDIAAIGRLVYQTGVAGRRVMIMSATLTSDVAEGLHAAYIAGWSEHARTSGVTDHVNALCVGDAPGACVTNVGRSFLEAYETCRNRMIADLRQASPLRRGEILPACPTWEELVAQVDAGCARMHDTNASAIDGFRVSVGLVGMSRISHTSALAMQLPAGEMRDRLRVKVCLHANFPRLHRAWIETRLKRALTRSGSDPNGRLRALCIAEGLFKSAKAAGVKDIEIVCVSSPVIQTGNDLDFDYAILDPVSMRSIIQAAGRVRRHRAGAAPGSNVLLLGRSPVALQDNRLAMPGVETRPHTETNVARRRLDRFGDRLFVDLAGDADFRTITAAALLSGDGNVPLRDEETALRTAMISTAPGAPLGTYLCDPMARLNLRFTRRRVFRRSTVRNVRYVLQGETLENAEWMIDLAPGTRDSRLDPAVGRGLHLHEVSTEADWLFREKTQSAWLDLSGGMRAMEASDMRRLLAVEIPDYTRDSALVPEMSFCEFTGFTRGTPEALHMAFGTTRELAGRP